MAPLNSCLYSSPTRPTLLVLQVDRILGCTSEPTFRVHPTAISLGKIKTSGPREVLTFEVDAADDFFGSGNATPRRHRSLKTRFDVMHGVFLNRTIYYLVPGIGYTIGTKKRPDQWCVCG